MPDLPEFTGFTTETDIPTGDFREKGKDDRVVPEQEEEGGETGETL